MTGRSLRLLIADDSASDIYLFKRAFNNHPTAHEVYTVADGEAAIDFLKRKGRYSEAPKIDLLVLDINMPKLTGHEVLEAMKADLELRRIPVVMLTSSADEGDISRAYGAHANCYIQKPFDWESWSEVVHAIESFWLKTVSLPENPT
jgi:two-component system, chemotaxis family, response regulator Rcp1